MSDKLLSVAWKIVDDRNLNHCIATRLLLHRCASNIYKNLSSKRRVVNLHVVLEQLVVSLARNTLADKVHAMTNIVQVLNALNLINVTSRRR